MLLEAARQWFDSHGLPCAWRKDLGLDGRPAHAILRPPQGATIPLEPLGLAIVVPDLHLATGNDVFRYNTDTHARRLERFLGALVTLRNELTDQFTGFACVQLGDFYDLMRADGIDANSKRQHIDARYPEVMRLCRALPMLHCIGNHDKDFWFHPPPTDQANYAIARTLGSGNMLCFHGHDKVTLFNILVHNRAETLALSVLNAINTLPFFGELTSWLQANADHSLEDEAFGTTQSLPWDRGSQGPSGWSAPWVDRGDTADLGNVIRGFEKGLDRELAVAFIGHSHRPGISWAPVAQRRVPLIDVGSWTYGRAEFAIVAEDGIGLAQLTAEPLRPAGENAVGCRPCSRSGPESLPSWRSSP